MYNILIVDDEKVILQSLPHLIDWNSLGFNISGTASDGRAALDFIKENHPDVVITDITMPLISGIELIQRVHEFNTHIKFIISTGYAEFEYAQQAMSLGVSHYLLKPIEESELISALNAIYQEIQQNIKTSELVITDLLNDTGNEKKTDHLPSVFSSAKYYCYVEIIAEEAPAVLYMSNNRKKTSASIKRAYNYLKKIFDDSKSYAISHIANNNIFTIVPFGNNSGYSNAAEFVKTIKNALSYEPSEAFSILIGKPVTNISKISDSKTSIEMLKDKKFYSSLGAVLNYESVKNVKFNKFLKNPEIIDMITAAAQKANLEETYKYISLFTDELQSQQIVVHSVKLYVSSITSTTLRSVRNPDIIIRLMSLLVEFNRLEYITIETTKLFLNDFFNIAISSMIDDRKAASLNIISEILDYISAHLSENLSLKLLAAEFHMNTAYLGRLFKQKTNCTFNSYLNKIRIERSKELLETTSLKIHEISKKVGYNDLNYFVANFKNHTKMTPNNYRKQYLNSFKKSEH